MSYSPPQPPMYQASPSGSQQTHTMAIVSLIFGILGLVGVCPGLGSVIALITGYMAKNDIQRDPVNYSGSGLAMGGIVLGWIGVAFMVCGLCGFVLWLFFAGGMAILSTYFAATQPQSLLPLLIGLVI